VKVAAQKVHVKVAALAKTATAVAEMVATQRAAMPKGKPLSTTTPALKPKLKRAPKHAMNAWRVRNVARQQKAATTHANRAVNVQSVVNVVSAAKVKVVASAAHAANATKVAVNVPHAWTRTATPKPCH